MYGTRILKACTYWQSNLIAIILLALNSNCIIPDAPCVGITCIILMYYMSINF